VAARFSEFIRRVDNQIINTEVNFDAQVENGTAPYTYQWDFGDGTTASTRAALHRFTQAGTYQVKFTATDAKGQTASATTPWRVSNVNMKFVAGDTNGSPHVNGSALVARFNNPTSVALSNDGIIYVAEPETKVIRKVLPDGTTSDLAGTAFAPGTTDGIGPEVRFRDPKSIAVDGSGNVYVADSGTSIRKITPAGQVSTLASLKSATGDIFLGVATSQDGTVYVLSFSRILKVVNGEFVEFVGRLREPGQADGAATVARLNEPTGITVGPDNNVYVIEACKDIRKITPSGVVSSLRKTNITSSTQCPSQQAQSIAVNASGQIFNTAWTQVTVLDAQGNWVAYAGQNTGTYSQDLNGDRSTATFSHLNSIAVGPAGELVVTGVSNSLRKISAAGQVSTIAGVDPAIYRINSDQTVFDFRSRIAKYASGAMVATDVNCVRLVQGGHPVATLAGNCLTEGTNNGTGTTAGFSQLYGIAVDSNLNVFVAERDSHRIRKIDHNQVVTTYAGTGAYGTTDGPALSAEFAYPSNLAVDTANNLWVTTSSAGAPLRKISPSGNVTSVSLGQYCSNNSCAGIDDIVADANGSVYIAVVGNGSASKILKIDAAGQMSQLSSLNGGGLPQQTADHRLSIDPQGRLWLVNYSYDDAFRRLYRVDVTNGAITEVATWKSFLAQAFVGQPEIEFTRSVAGAAFNSDGSLMMVGGGTVFHANGLP
jgi:PKD repeat protein